MVPCDGYSLAASDHETVVPERGQISNFQWMRTSGQISNS